ncbi:hypothetical protein CYY_004447 [Polysphondylium violaceum]|uniref:Glycylpeptide N-tetradecanoyltransferase n=1 Tax=Polysphondylium violaceum TaxID=133409 RepID=A0A8J4V542_9MYCE|nr:hypothetical protein CYY_004447 [Polysphondylium violaceum]
MADNKQIVELLKKASKETPTHAFWDTQPVPKIADEVEQSGPIEFKTLDDVRKDPLGLPGLFEWVEIDVNSQTELQDLYTLLNENYVEDDDNMFRFDYSPSFLKWALQPPHYYKEWHIGVRVKETKKLVGFISAIPADVRVEDKVVKMVEINFLCVHKKLREKRLAPVLIKEITRRVNLKDIWQASYTAGVVLPRPVAVCRYWHRSLNPKKLIEVGFSSLPPKMTMSLMIKYYRVAEQLKNATMRKLEKKDCESATALLNQYLSKYRVAPTFTTEEFWHWFEPRENVMTCYVKVDSDNKVTDIFSYYNLPSSIIGNQKHKTLKAAFSFYNVATTTTIKELIDDALLVAKKEEFDVYNCLDIFENDKFFKDLKFAVGDGNLQYYLYNYSTPLKHSSEIGLVLL